MSHELSSWVRNFDASKGRAWGNAKVFVKDYDVLEAEEGNTSEIVPYIYINPTMLK